MTTKINSLSATKRLMGALVRMKPKPHEEMKAARRKEHAKGSVKKRASSKPKNV